MAGYSMKHCVVLQNYRADSTEVISVVKNLVQVYKRLHKWEKAAPLCRQLVEFRERLSADKPDPNLATALVNLAVIYCHLVRCNMS